MIFFIMYKMNGNTATHYCTLIRFVLLAIKHLQYFTFLLYYYYITIYILLLYHYTIYYYYITIYILLLYYYTIYYYYHISILYTATMLALLCCSRMRLCTSVTEAEVERAKRIFKASFLMQLDG